MGFRAMLLTAGIIETLLSLFVGIWAAWVGIPLIFIACILHFIDKE